MPTTPAATNETTTIIINADNDENNTSTSTPGTVPRKLIRPLSLAYLSGSTRCWKDTGWTSSQPTQRSLHHRTQYCAGRGSKTGMLNDSS